MVVRTVCFPCRELIRKSLQSTEEAATTLRLLLWLSLAALLFVFSPISTKNVLATGSATPTVDDTRKAIENELKNKYSGQLKLLEIIKTDGQSGQWMGTPTYKLEFKLTTEVLKTLYYSPMQSSYVPTWVQYQQPVFWAGEKYTANGEALFTLKESGWVMEGSVGIHSFSLLPDSAPNLAHAQHDIDKLLQTGATSWFTVLRVETIDGVPMGEKYRISIRVVVEGKSPVGGWSFQCPKGISCDTDFSGPPAIQYGRQYTKEGWVDFMLSNHGWSPSSLVLKEAKLGTKPTPSTQGATAGQGYAGVGQAAQRKLADLQPFSASVPAGFTCRPDITVTVGAPDETAFTSNRVELQKLIGGLRAILGFECPNTPTTNMLVVGEAGGKEVYRGSASGSSNWILADLRSPEAASAPAQPATVPVGEGSVSKEATAPQQLPREATKTGSAPIVEGASATTGNTSANQRAQEAVSLIQASREGNLEKVRELLTKGADVNAKQNDGETALLAASRRGEAGVVRELLTKGADVNARDRLGDTALNIAVDKGYQNIMDLLKAGPVVSGMTMEQVLVVRGAPTHKEVIPPDMELWHYPASEVAFQNGKVSYVQ